MRKAFFVAVPVIALTLGYLAGSGRLGFGGPTERRTIIMLRRHPSDAAKCISDTQDRRMRAKREWSVAWRINQGQCQLATGGVVQLRFATTSPMNVGSPTETNGWISGIVRDNADILNYPYKVWAHFPQNPGQDYPLEDPDLEIVF